MAVYFIYQKVAGQSIAQREDFMHRLDQTLFKNPLNILILLLFTFFNWGFELVKWQNLVHNVHPITIVNAAQQSLGALTASLFTPNRIGEYGAKAIYYKKGNRRKIMLLNLISNMTQMAITIIAGVIGLSFFLIQQRENLTPDQKKHLLVILIGILIASGIAYVTLKTIRGFYLDKIKLFIQTIPKIRLLCALGYSLLRYLIFSHQFYFLLLLFGANLSYLEAMTAISAVYLIASIIPSISFFDWLIKGSVAVWVFTFYGVSELAILSLTLLMWLLNFGMPALIGSYFVLNFNLKQRL